MLFYQETDTFHFPGGSVVNNPPALQETGPVLGQEDPLEKEMATHAYILIGKSCGQRSLVGYSPWGHKELDTTEQLSTQHADRFQSPSSLQKGTRPPVT